jgi:hypothetical protein
MPFFMAGNINCFRHLHLYMMGNVLKLTNAAFNQILRCSIFSIAASGKLNFGPAKLNHAAFREFPHSVNNLK